MNDYSLETLESITTFRTDGRDAYGTLDLFVAALKARIEVDLNLLNNNQLLPSSVETINDIVNLSDVAYHRLLELLHEDALRTRQEVGFVDPDKAGPLPRIRLLDRLLGRKNVAPMVMLSANDPKHPCYLEDGINSVESNVEWLRFRIDEHSETQARLCLLDCRPRWEDEHGVTIVIRDGVPMSTGPYDVDLEAFDTVAP
jgi:hypothetical protein